ncbi:MAG: ABC transporter permease subunit [Parcubacteria group bacterium]
MATPNMDKRFFKKTIKDFKWTALIYAIIVVAYAVMIIGFFPSIRDNAGSFEELLEVYPESLMDAFGVTAESFSSLEGFLSVEYLSFVWVMIVTILIFTLSASSVAGEIDKGISEFSFTLPVKRWRIALGKFGAAYLIYAFVALATVLSIMLGAAMVGESFNLGGMGAFLLVAFAMGFFLLTLTSFVSAFSRTKGRVYGICGAFLGVSYLLHILNGISESVSSVYYFSFFKYYGNTQEVLLSGDINLVNIGVFVVFGAVFLGFTLWILEKRDL